MTSVSSLPRAILGRLVLSVAFLAGSLAYTGVLVRSLVLDRSLVADTSDAVLRDPTVQRTVSTWVADGIRDQLLDPKLVDAARVYKVDVDADLRVVAQTVVATPAFRAMFSKAITDIHHAVLVDHAGPAPHLDLTALVPLVHDTAVARNPVFDRLVPRTGGLDVAVPASALPDATVVSRVASAEHVTDVAALALVLAALGVLVHPDRAKAIRRVGRFLVGLGIGQIALVLAVPHLIGLLPSDAAALAGAALAALRVRLLVPAGIVVAVGVALWICGRHWLRLAARVMSDEGRRAFVEPAPARPAPVAVPHTAPRVTAANPAPTAAVTAPRPPVAPVRPPFAPGPPTRPMPATLAGPQPVRGPVVAGPQASVFPLAPRPAPERSGRARAAAADDDPTVVLDPTALRTLAGLDRRDDRD